MNIPCKICKNTKTSPILQLGIQPIANSLVGKDNLMQPVTAYPLQLCKCEKCHLIQIDYNFDPSKIFNKDYVYFSSVNKPFVEHSQKFANKIIDELKLDGSSFVYEIASNDGYLLREFRNRDIPCVGIEPSASTAKIAIEQGINTEVTFLNQKTARKFVTKYRKSDLVIANNVLAHVPDIEDFLKSIRILLNNGGIATLEFPHALNIIRSNQFDTVYHEHYSYLTLMSLNYCLRMCDLRAFKVDKIATHGGSLRVYVCAESDNREDSASVEEVLSEELEFGLDSFDVYSKFADVSRRTGVQALRYLSEKKLQGESIFAYGAAAKASTFFNFCGINSILVEGIADITPSKIGKYMPLNGIPVISEDSLFRSKPDTILIMAWNWRDEIINRLSQKINFKCDLVTFIPELEVVSIND